ncbi:hypothetical protein V8C86DRAFT_2620999 [Haematococcus lacustris]
MAGVTYCLSPCPRGVPLLLLLSLLLLLLLLLILLNCPSSCSWLCWGLASFLRRGGDWPGRSPRYRGITGAQRG